MAGLVQDSEDRHGSGQFKQLIRIQVLESN